MINTSNISSAGLCVVIQGMKHVPSFKNHKRIFRNRLITRPNIQLWMMKAIHDIQSQLKSFTQTKEKEIATEPVLQSLIVYGKEFDDSLQWIPEINIRCRKVNRGEEGAIILIHKL